MKIRSTRIKESATNIIKIGDQLYIHFGEEALWEYLYGIIENHKIRLVSK